MMYLVSFIVALALFHFVYESIIAPSIRLDLRFKLFALRDQVRSLKMEHGDELDNKHFQYLHDSINVLIQFLSRIDIVTAIKADAEFSHNPDFQKQVQARQKILDDCPFESARDLRRRTVRIAGICLVANSGAWLIYTLPVVLPAALGIVCISATSSVRNWFAQKIRSWTAIPSTEMERLAPDCGFAELAA